MTSLYDTMMPAILRKLSKELVCIILTGIFLSQYHIIWTFMHEMISWSSIYTTWLSDSIKVAPNWYFFRAFATEKEGRRWNVLGSNPRWLDSSIRRAVLRNLQMRVQIPLEITNCHCSVRKNMKRFFKTHCVSGLRQITSVDKSPL